MHALIDRIKTSFMGSGSAAPAPRPFPPAESPVPSLRAEAVRLMLAAKCAPFGPDRTPPWTVDRLLALQRKGAGAYQLCAAIHPIEVHALSLLLELRVECTGDEILAEDLERDYVEFCTLNWWKPQRWAYRNGVAHHFRLLNGDVNNYYRWVERPDGSVHRLSVYKISGREPAPAPTRRRRMRADQTPIPLMPRFANEAARVAA